MAVPAAPASAAPTTWQFTITGLQYHSNFDDETGERSLVGSFTGEDLNHDGLLYRGELTRFVLGVQYLPSVGSLTDDLNCDPDMADCTYWSHLDRFSYNMKTGWLGAQGASSHNDFLFGNYVRAWDRGRSWEWDWTPETQIQIVPSPVPEPASVGLLAAGVGALGWRLRRRAGPGKA
jgi:hypothetical protein